MTALATHIEAKLIIRGHKDTWAYSNLANLKAGVYMLPYDGGNIIPLERLLLDNE
jgi:hypothetical protein